MKRSLAWVWLFSVLGGGVAAGGPWIPVGVSKVDLSPTNAVRMMGYAVRRNEAEGVAQPIHARAIAIGEGTNAAVLVCADNCILPAPVADEIRRRLGARAGIGPDQVTIAVSHTHSAPCLEGAAPNIFAGDIPAEHRGRIAAYTRYFEDRVEAAALQALSSREPARLSRGLGFASFARNRRTEGGPVDHDVPLLRVTGADGRVRAVLMNYACHCTTLGGEFNQVHGDWSAEAARAFEQEHEGSVALVAIGCGADANPFPRGRMEHVQQHGHELAAEASRLVTGRLESIDQAPVCRRVVLQLPYQAPFTRAQWEQRATNAAIVGYHARRWIERIDRGEVPPPTLPYPVQTWVFGDQLALVFLGGEVVVDYSLRLKQELDASRIWVNAYANDVPCYIPSRRILREGGYEAESSLWYYDRPQQLSPAIEDQIVQAVRSLLPAGFIADPTASERPPPREVPAALEQFRLPPGLAIEPVAAEPLVQSPVAIDFAADGSLWVCEMFDYPSGLDGEGRPGGRVKRLRDDDGDGTFDRAELWADGLPFPTGVMGWGDGVLVCAAPRLLWIRNPGGGEPSGAALRTEVLMEGFATHNFQARINGLRWGLDGWIHGSGGLFGGDVILPRGGRSVAAKGRDFRFHPGQDDFEALAGVAQQGRVRDDFDEWFGNDNSTLLWHYVLDEAVVRRNPHVLPPRPVATVARDADPGRVFPVSRTLTRYNDFAMANRLTSACGPEIYRDDLMGAEFRGNAFICEPVHNLVRRAVLEPDGPTFAARRAPREHHSEFLSSRDNWFRPVEARTGPDGALWIVDMYRFVIEHPRWIPAERLRGMDVRAGANRGRIYRVFAKSHRPRSVPNLARLSQPDLAGLLASPNGVLRDLAHRALTGDEAVATPARQVPSGRNDSGWRAAIGTIRRHAGIGGSPESRAQAIATLAQVGELSDDVLEAALAETHPRLRRFAVKELAREARRGRPLEPFEARLRLLAADGDAAVRFEVACLLGDYRGTPPAGLWASLVTRDAGSPWVQAALQSSLGRCSEPDAVDVLGLARTVPGRDRLVASLFETWVDGGFEARLAGLVPMLASRVQTADGAPGDHDLLHFLAALSGRPDLADGLVGTTRRPGAQPGLRALEARAAGIAARRASDPAESIETRGAAIRWLGAAAKADPARRVELFAVWNSRTEPALRTLATRELAGLTAPEVADGLLDRWALLPPVSRSERLQLLLSRESWTERLLAATELGTVSAADVSPEQRQRLRGHSTPAIRSRAVVLFPAPVDRGAVLSRFSAATNTPASVARGPAMFDRLCAQCHRVRGRGVEVGPDLGPFKAKPPMDLLVAMLDPNAAIDPRFMAQTVTLKDSRVLTGVVREQGGGAIEVVQPGGVREAIHRDQVQTMATLPNSLMPEGLEQGVEPGELAELIHWIQSTPPPWGSARGAQAIAAHQEFLARSPSRIHEVRSTELVPAGTSWMGQIPMEVCRQSSDRTRLSWRATPVGNDVSGRRLFRFAVAMGYRSQPAAGFRLQAGSGAAVDFDVVTDDSEWADAGGRLGARFEVRERSDEDASGLLEVGVDAGLVDADGTVRFELVSRGAGSQRWFGLFRVPGVAE